MELTEDLQGARIGVAQAAELANMHPSHFRRLVRSGVFPKPKRTAKSRPYFDYELLTRIAEVLNLLRLRTAHPHRRGFEVRHRREWRGSYFLPTQTKASGSKAAHAGACGEASLIIPQESRRRPAPVRHPEE